MMTNVHFGAADMRTLVALLSHPKRQWAAATESVGQRLKYKPSERRQ